MRTRLKQARRGAQLRGAHGAGGGGSVPHCVPPERQEGRTPRRPRRGGQTLRYEIHIDAFARHGESLLFFFHYECFVGDQMVLRMDGGCAGFFSEEELDQGKGVIHTEKELQARQQIQPTNFSPLLVGQAFIPQ